MSIVVCPPAMVITGAVLSVGVVTGGTEDASLPPPPPQALNINAVNARPDRREIEFFIKLYLLS